MKFDRTFSHSKQRTLDAEKMADWQRLNAHLERLRMAVERRLARDPKPGSLKKRCSQLGARNKAPVVGTHRKGGVAIERIGDYERNVMQKRRIFGVPQNKSFSANVGDDNDDQFDSRAQLEHTDRGKMLDFLLYSCVQAARMRSASSRPSSVEYLKASFENLTKRRRH